MWSNILEQWAMCSIWQQIYRLKPEWKLASAVLASVELSGDSTLSQDDDLESEVACHRDWCQEFDLQVLHSGRNKNWIVQVVLWLLIYIVIWEHSTTNMNFSNIYTHPTWYKLDILPCNPFFWKCRSTQDLGNTWWQEICKQTLGNVVSVWLLWRIVSLDAPVDLGELLILLPSGYPKHSLLWNGVSFCTLPHI